MTRADRFAVLPDASAERLRWVREALVAGCRTAATVAAFASAAAPHAGCSAEQADAALAQLRRRGAAVQGPGGWAAR